MGKLLSKFLCLFALYYAVVDAGYYIDDANSTIRYTSVGGTRWFPLNSTNGYHINSGNGSRYMLDFGRLYDQTAYVTFIDLHSSLTILIPMFYFKVMYVDIPNIKTLLVMITTCSSNMQLDVDVPAQRTIYW
jgi:hypothetical protein